MDSPCRPRILRAIQERVVTPVGGRSQKIDVRIIAATHRDLDQWVRPDISAKICHRLNVVPVELQPLRERVVDIGPLLNIF